MQNKDFVTAMRDLIFDYFGNDEDRSDWLISRGWMANYGEPDKSGVVQIVSMVHPSSDEKFTIEKAMFEEVVLITQESGITRIGFESPVGDYGCHQQ
jgi:hypothetical protein